MIYFGTEKNYSVDKDTGKFTTFVMINRKLDSLMPKESTWSPTTI